MFWHELDSTAEKCVIDFYRLIVIMLLPLCIKTFHRVLLTVITGNRHISSIGCTDKSLKSQHVLCFYVFGHPLCWPEKIFCLEDVVILHNAGMKICILSTFPAYGKVGVNPKIFG